jgi:hypothetical protein
MSGTELLNLSNANANANANASANASATNLGDLVNLNERRPGAPLGPPANLNYPDGANTGAGNNSVDIHDEDDDDDGANNSDESRKALINAVTNNDDITDEALLHLWDTETNIRERDKLIVLLQKRNLFPSAFVNQWEYMSGSYPDTMDPEFIQKLMKKREFALSLQKPLNMEDDICKTDVKTFEITPVQRFVATYMSPSTPYMSALLYHGVGVGKTCAAIQITEAWLESYPSSKVYIVAPVNIQEGFYRTIFDITRVQFGKKRRTAK